MMPSSLATSATVAAPPPTLLATPGRWPLPSKKPPKQNSCGSRRQNSMQASSWHSVTTARRASRCSRFSSASSGALEPLTPARTGANADGPPVVSRRSAKAMRCRAPMATDWFVAVVSHSWLPGLVRPGRLPAGDEKCEPRRVVR